MNEQNKVPEYCSHILTAGKKAIWETDFKYTSFVNFIPKCFIFDSVKTGIIKKKLELF